MTQDQVEKSYAVICLHCRQLIPVSHGFTDRQERQDGGSRERGQVFHLRCMNCGKEKPYRISEIVEVEESGNSQAESWSWQQPLSRSAASH